jgi:hypothetical protein
MDEVWRDGQVREGGGGFEQMLSLPESPSSVSGGQGISGAALAKRVEYGDEIDDSGEHFDSTGCEDQGEIGPASDSEETTNFSHVSIL